MKTIKTLLLGSVLISTALIPAVTVVSCSKAKKNPFKTIIDKTKDWTKGKNKNTPAETATPAPAETTQGGK
ncbi:hypothetical protein [Mycoplasma sp. HF14]